MKRWIDYFDQNGILCQKGPIFDGGDSANHDGLARLANKVIGATYPSNLSSPQLYQKLVSNGLLMRNPRDYNNVLDSSRDLYIGFSCHLNFIEDGGLMMLNELYKALPRKYGIPIYPNGDLFSFNDLVVFNGRSNWLLNQLGDLENLFNTLILTLWATKPANRLFVWLVSKYPTLWPLIALNPPNSEGVQTSLRGPNWTSDDLNLVQMLTLGAIIKPTLFNILSRFLYAKLRINGPQWALDSYFASDDSPPVNTLYPNLIKRYFKWT